MAAWQAWAWATLPGRQGSMGMVTTSMAGVEAWQGRSGSKARGRRRRQQAGLGRGALAGPGQATRWWPRLVVQRRAKRQGRATGRPRSDGAVGGVRRHARGRLPLLHIPAPELGPAPLLLGLAGRAMAARRRSARLDGGGDGAGAGAGVWVRGDGRAQMVGYPEKGRRKWRSAYDWGPGRPPP